MPVEPSQRRALAGRASPAGVHTMAAGVSTPLRADLPVPGRSAQVMPPFNKKRGCEHSMQLCLIPLASRLDAAKNGSVCQPEYVPCLIQAWADMPIKAYFGSQTGALQQLYRILDISEDANPPYQLVAELIFEQMHSCTGMDEEALSLLTVPVKAYIGAGEKREGR